MNSENVIYFIGALGGPIKIGYGYDPQARLGELQVGNHQQLHLLATASGGRAEEMKLHQRFAAHRLRGEWFAPAPELLQFVWKLANGRRRQTANAPAVAEAGPIRLVAPPRFIRLDEVKQRTGLSRTSIYTDPTFPESVKIGPRAVAWVEAEIERWCEDKMAERLAA